MTGSIRDTVSIFNQTTLDDAVPHLFSLQGKRVLLIVVPHMALASATLPTSTTTVTHLKYTSHTYYFI